MEELTPQERYDKAIEYMTEAVCDISYLNFRKEWSNAIRIAAGLPVYENTSNKLRGDIIGGAI